MTNMDKKIAEAMLKYALDNPAKLDTVSAAQLRVDYFIAGWEAHKRTETNEILNS